MADEKKAGAKGGGEDQQKAPRESKGERPAKDGKGGGAKRARGGEGRGPAEKAAIVSTAEVVAPRMSEKYAAHVVPALIMEVYPTMPL